MSNCNCRTICILSALWEHYWMEIHYINTQLYFLFYHQLILTRIKLYGWDYRLQTRSWLVQLVREYLTWLLSHLTTDSSHLTRAGGGGARPAADHLAVQPRPLVAVRPLEPVQRLQPDPGEVCEELLVLDTTLKHPHNENMKILGLK